MNLRNNATFVRAATAHRAAAKGSGPLPLTAFALLLLATTACSIGPKYQRPTAPVPSAYREPLPAGWKEAQPSDGPIRGKWWEVYNDPQLNELEEQVAVSNQNVHVAEAQFRQARAAIRVARAGLYPTIGASPSVSAVRTPSNFAGGGQVASSSNVRGSYNLPFSLSYEPDIWGSIHKSIAASSAQAQVSAADLANVKLLYQSEVALDYFDLHGIDGDRDLLTTTVKSYEDYLELTRNRYASGVASMADVAQAQTQLETVRAQLVDLGVQRAQFEHAIAILTGRPPAGFSIPPAPIRIMPPPLPAGVPSALLERRPDIAASERLVAAANEQIGISQAAFYPNLTLSAGGGSETSHILQWFTWPSRFWSVGPGLAQTLFDAGRRRAQVSVAEAAYDATVAGYRQTVLTAFQQVEDNLAALRILAEEAEVQARAVAAAQESLTISTAQYKGGVVSYLQVITAQTTALQNQRTALDILTRRMAASVSLIQALGGGWDASQLPKSQELMAQGK